MNIEIDQKLASASPVALIAAVSREKGLEYWLTFKDSVNTNKYLQFLEGLRSALPGIPTVLFLDNLRVHHSNRSKEAYSLLGFDVIFNVAYSPENNPIETYWSLVKRNYKRKKLEQILCG